MRWIRDIRADPDHEARRALDGLLQQLADDLLHDEATMASAERLKVRVLSQPQFAEAGTAVWRSLSRTVAAALDDPDSTLRRRIEGRLQAYAVRIRVDADLRARLDGYAIDAAAFVASRYGDELTTVITNTIARWDGREAADRIELHVGRDLQFIRINGTVVGAVVGLVIHTLTHL